MTKRRTTRRASHAHDSALRAPSTGNRIIHDKGGVFSFSFNLKFQRGAFGCSLLNVCYQASRARSAAGSITASCPRATHTPPIHWHVGLSDALIVAARVETYRHAADRPLRSAHKSCVDGWAGEQLDAHRSPPAFHRVSSFTSSKYPAPWDCFI